MSQQCHNTLRVSGLRVKATVPSYNLLFSWAQNFSVLISCHWSSVYFISTRLLFTSALRNTEACQADTWADGIRHLGCDLLNIIGQPAFKTLRMRCSHTDFPFLYFRLLPLLELLASSFFELRWTCSFWKTGKSSLQEVLNPPQTVFCFPRKDKPGSFITLS